MANIPLALCYIAGPFRGPTPFDVKINVHEAEMLGLEVAAIGGYPIIPHSMTGNFDKQLTDQFWLEGSLELLRRCDAIVMNVRWRESVGAKAEHIAAERMGMPIFYREAEGWSRSFRKWLDEWTLKRG